MIDYYFYTTYNVHIGESFPTWDVLSVFRGMFSDGNFSYGIEPLSSGEVSQSGTQPQSGTTS